MYQILVVEDDLDIQELLENHLRSEGYGVDLASDGVEAMSLFSQGKYDLVLLDVMLPKIDGYGVCELMRKQSQVPIVMLTALDSEEDQIKGLDLAGYKAYVKDRDVDLTAREFEVRVD